MQVNQSGLLESVFGKFGKGAGLALLVAVSCQFGTNPFDADSAFAAQPETQTVSIVAKKYEFTPKEFTVKKGIPVTLKLSSADRIHGFMIPELNLRADVVPGRPCTLQFTPAEVGTLHFYCDVVCGNGHDDMSGKITVVAK